MRVSVGTPVMLGYRVHIDGEVYGDWIASTDSAANAACLAELLKTLLSGLQATLKAKSGEVESFDLIATPYSMRDFEDLLERCTCDTPSSNPP